MKKLIILFGLQLAIITSGYAHTRVVNDILFKASYYNRGYIAHNGYYASWRISCENDIELPLNLIDGRGNDEKSIVLRARPLLFQNKLMILSEKPMGIFAKDKVLAEVNLEGNKCSFEVIDYSTL